MKPVEGPMLSERGYAPVCNSQGSTTRSKVNETYGRSDNPREWGYAPVCDDEQTKMQNASKLLYLKYTHPSCNENVQPQISNAKQDHVL